MGKLAILAVLFFMASAVPILARMTQMEGQSNDIDVVLVEEIVRTKLGCARPGESCWNGVQCCGRDICAEGPYNAICVEWIDPPYLTTPTFPPPGWVPKKANH